MMFQNYNMEDLIKLAAFQAVITHGSNDAWIPCSFQTVFQKVMQGKSKDNWLQTVKNGIAEADKIMMESIYSEQYKKSNFKVLVNVLL